MVGVVTGIGGALLVWAAVALGANSGWFAFLVVWVPMTCLGTISRVMQPRMPRRYHELRDFERNGRAYEVVGIRVVKWTLRRGPIAVFNPDLHLPAQQSPGRVAHLEQRMRDAEASHTILFLATVPVVLHAAARGWWGAAALTLLFDVVMNGYPVMLQRYNRARLNLRYPQLSSSLHEHAVEAE